MLGRGRVMEPVWMPSVASAWLLWSAFIERIRHRSSAHSATCGNKSLISMPDLPRGLNSHCGRLRYISCRGLLGLADGGGRTVLPASANSLGLGSNESTWETPPLM